MDPGISGGQKKRVSIAEVLACRGRVSAVKCIVTLDR
jgi:energy-coupling factor transporter ATP-binding protein EcfA2